jgi:hypothetical protein
MAEPLIEYHRGAGSTTHFVHEKERLGRRVPRHYQTTKLSYRSNAPNIQPNAYISPRPDLPPGTSS